MKRDGIGAKVEVIGAKLTVGGWVFDLAAPYVEAVHPARGLLIHIPYADVLALKRLWLRLSRQEQLAEQDEALKAAAEQAGIG